jgi:hypothetical protein
VLSGNPLYVSGTAIVVDEGKKFVYNREKKESYDIRSVILFDKSGVKI